jgi:hypothetical protein
MVLPRWPMASRAVCSHRLSFCAAVFVGTGKVTGSAAMEGVIVISQETSSDY